MKPTTRNAAPFFETLEQRTLLSAPYPFVTAGVSFDPTTDLPTGMFWGEGSVDAHDQFTGSFERFDAASRTGAGILPWAGFTRPDKNRMLLTAAAGFAGYAAQTGSQFIAEEGFPLGAFVGRNADGKVLDTGVFVEPFFNGNIGLQTYLVHDYFLTTLTVMTPERGLETAALVAKPKSFHSEDWTFEYFFAGGEHRTVDVRPVSVTPQLTVFDNGTRVYSTTLNRTKFFVVDADGTDGVVGFGAGWLRYEEAPDAIAADQLPGIYRGSVLNSGPESAAFFGASVVGVGITGGGVTDTVIELGGSDFKVYNAADYDRGVRTPVNTGTWVYLPNDRTHRELDLGRVEMTDTEGKVAVVRAAGRLLPTDSNHLLVPISVTGVGETTGEAISGTLRAPTPVVLTFLETVYSVNPDGHVIALQYAVSTGGSNVGWYSQDLTETFGAVAASGPLYSWHNYTFTRASVVARGADGDLLLWERSNGNWTFTNLTATVGGAEPLAGDLSGVQFVYSGTVEQRPLAAILSTNAAGGFIAYVQTSAAGWEFVGVEALGLLGEGVHPNFVGSLAGYGTTWGGYNFAGLDDQGQIWVLWHSQQLGTQWASNNLSVAAGGTPRIVSQLTALTTAWSAFQISGLDEESNIVVTWWTWQLGWRHDALTQLIGGPTISGARLASNYNSELNLMNIVGIDGSGNAVVYWWSPSHGWDVSHPVAGLDSGTQPAGPMLVDGFRVRYTSTAGVTAAFQTITWDAVDGHTKRLAWNSAAPDAWVLDDLTELATPL